MSRAPASKSIVDAAIAQCRPSLWNVAVFSTIVNILALTGSIYMLQIYDRVMTSRSIPTLVGISVIILFAYILQGFCDAIRGRLLTRIGARFDSIVSPPLARATVVLPLHGVQPGEAMQPSRDLEAVRTFLSGNGLTAFIDLPFMPLFLVGCFLLHPWLGVTALVGAVMIVGLTLLTERVGRKPTEALTMSAAERSALLESGRGNAEVIKALGMEQNFVSRVMQVHDKFIRDNLHLSDSINGIGSAARVFRMLLQSAVLGLGGYLAMMGEISSGAIVASSILTSRALAPVELVVANWRPFISARQGLSRLRAILPRLERPAPEVQLPMPKRIVELQDVALAAPGSQKPIVTGVKFKLEAGQGLGIIGPSGSGKSSLARGLVGVWRPARGMISLDGSAIDQWASDALGQAIGYLPQDVELFDGTIGANIARLMPEIDSEKVIRAAQAAGAHEMISAMPQGYDTRLTDRGSNLSGGQRQRIALARALYGDPFLVVLDEPNANLDQQGDAALAEAIRGIRRRGGVVVVITHRPAGLAAVDQVAVVQNGQIAQIGPKAEVMKSVMAGGGTAQPANVQPMVKRRPQGLQEFDVEVAGEPQNKDMQA